MLYLPPYTPQYQLVETFFGIVKVKLRELRKSNIVKFDLRKGEEIVKSTLSSINPDTIIKCFNKAIINIQKAIN